MFDKKNRTISLKEQFLKRFGSEKKCQLGMLEF